MEPQPAIGDVIRQCLTGISCKALTELSSALLTPMIGITTAYVAYQQYRVNRTRLKIEQYDRRLAVYKAVDAFYGQVNAQGNATYSDIATLRIATAEAEFLFPGNVTRHLNEVTTKALRMASLHLLMYPGSGERGLPVGPERSKVAEEHGQINIWMFETARPESKRIFSKYLRLL